MAQVLSYVVGFFNNQSWPIMINISSVGVSTMIGPKEYVRLRDGRKVNDPVLEAYTGPDMLSKEISKTAVPMVLFPIPQAMPVSNQSAVSTSPQVHKDPRGIVQDSSFQGIDQPAPGPNQKQSIQVYTMEQAYKKGIIKPLVQPSMDKAPGETTGVALRGEQIPELSSLMPRVATPGETKKIIAERKGEKLPELKTPPAAVGEGQPAAVDSPSFDGLDAVDADGQETPETPEETEPTTISPEEMKVRTDALLSSITPPAGEKAFVCAADGRSFTRKNKLKEHIKKHFPDRVDELMAPYELKA